MSRDPDTRNLAWAVATLRAHAAIDARASVKHAVEILDEAGIFAAVDEANEIDAALDLLVESTARSLAETARPGRAIKDPLAWLRAIKGR